MRPSVSFFVFDRWVEHFCFVSDWHSGREGEPALTREAAFEGECEPHGSMRGGPSNTPVDAKDPSIAADEPSAAAEDPSVATDEPAGGGADVFEVESARHGVILSSPSNARVSLSASEGGCSYADKSVALGDSDGLSAAALAVRGDSGPGPGRGDVPVRYFGFRENH